MCIQHIKEQTQLITSASECLSSFCIPFFLPCFPSTDSRSVGALYGAWVGLSGDAVRINLTLSNQTTSPGVLHWEDGITVNRGLLQSAWGVSAVDGKTRMGLPSMDGSVCVYLSNQTQLRRPGFMAAGSCSWLLPFVCESSIPTDFSSLPPFAPPPDAPSAAQVPTTWVDIASWGGSTGPGE
jgi:hypothetical protein